MRAGARKKRGLETLRISGRQYAVVPFAEYRRLCDSADDAYDATVARQHLGEINSGKIEPIQNAVIERLYGSGENPILVWREYRGLTQAQLATRVSTVMEQDRLRLAAPTRRDVDHVVVELGAGVAQGRHRSASCTKCSGILISCDKLRRVWINAV